MSFICHYCQRIINQWETLDRKRRKKNKENTAKQKDFIKLSKWFFVIFSSRLLPSTACCFQKTFFSFAFIVVKLSFESIMFFFLMCPNTRLRNPCLFFSHPRSSCVFCRICYIKEALNVWWFFSSSFFGFMIILFDCAFILQITGKCAPFSPVIVVGILCVQPDQIFQYHYKNKEFQAFFCCCCCCLDELFFSFIHILDMMATVRRIREFSNAQAFSAHLLNNPNSLWHRYHKATHFNIVQR